MSPAWLTKRNYLRLSRPEPLPARCNEPRTGRLFSRWAQEFNSRIHGELQPLYGKDGIYPLVDKQTSVNRPDGR